MEIILILLLFASINLSYCTNRTDNYDKNFWGFLLNSETIRLYLPDDSNYEKATSTSRDKMANSMVNDDFITYVSDPVNSDLNFQNKIINSTSNKEFWTDKQLFETIDSNIKHNNLKSNDSAKNIAVDLKNYESGEEAVTNDDDFIVTLQTEISTAQNEKIDFLNELTKNDKESIVERKTKSKFEEESYGEAPLYYLLSRFCYEIRIAKKKNFTQSSLGKLIYGDSSEIVKFRKKFGIQKQKKMKRDYSKIKNYFYQRKRLKQKQCLPNINEKKIKENIMHWKTKVKNHKQFEELKEMGDRISPSTKNETLLFEEIYATSEEALLLEKVWLDFKEASFYYLLSRFCYELRITKKAIFTQISFGELIYGDAPEIITFRENFGIEKLEKKKKEYSKIKNYFRRKHKNHEKQCLLGVTEKGVRENIIYWKTKVKNHEKFEELKEMVDTLFPSSCTF